MPTATQLTTRPNPCCCSHSHTTHPNPSLPTPSVPFPPPPGAVDRFAQFFVAPLFTESATQREMNAVNSENDKNLQQVRARGARSVCVCCEMGLGSGGCDERTNRHTHTHEASAYRNQHLHIHTHRTAGTDGFLHGGSPWMKEAQSTHARTPGHTDAHMPDPTHVTTHPPTHPQAPPPDPLRRGQGRAPAAAVPVREPQDAAGRPQGPRPRRSGPVRAGCAVICLVGWWALCGLCCMSCVIMMMMMVVAVGWVRAVL